MVAPEMRAAHTQSLLQAAERLPPTDRERVRAELGTQAQQTITSTLAVGWLPMSLHMRLSDAIRETIGSERNIALWRETMIASFDRPLLRGFVNVIVSLFGAEPSAFFRRGEQIHAHLTRGLGTIRFDQLNREQCRVDLTGFPSDKFTFGCYVEGLHGCLDAIFPVCKTRGTTEVERTDGKRGDVRYLLTWTP